MDASLKQLVIAEGVEKQDQLVFLKTQHCEEGQGYFFSRPIIAEQFAQLLATGRCDVQENQGSNDKYRTQSLNKTQQQAAKSVQ